jgi:hypothetical protein
MSNLSIVKWLDQPDQPDHHYQHQCLWELIQSPIVAGFYAVMSLVIPSLLPKINTQHKIVNEERR